MISAYILTMIFGAFIGIIYTSGQLDGHVIESPIPMFVALFIAHFAYTVVLGVLAIREWRQEVKEERERQAAKYGM